MNLKESFRYQNFLDDLMTSACTFVRDRDNAFVITKSHHRSKANPDAEDIVETVEFDTRYVPNDDIIKFMQWLVDEREKLTKEISKTKATLMQETGFDIDAAVEANKFRQSANRAVKSMLGHTTTKRTERGQEYKFNAEGNQMPYYYEIEVTATEAYDKEAAKAFMRSVITEADKMSEHIDKAMINSNVQYEPKFDVNETFEDVMAEFIASK